MMNIHTKPFGKNNISCKFNVIVGYKDNLFIRKSYNLKIHQTIFQYHSFYLVEPLEEPY